MKAQEKLQGRPIKNIVEPIKASPTEVAKAIMQSPPKKNWEYQKRQG